MKSRVLKDCVEVAAILKKARSGNLACFVFSMKFDTYFRITSYATVAAATLALFVAGGIGAWLAIAFAILMLLAWKLEGSRWQLTERMALIAIIASLPFFYLDWRILEPYLQVEFLETGQRSTRVAVLASDHFSFCHQLRRERRS